MRPLNAKQKTFIAEYLKDKNASKAAIAAGYSKKASRAVGSELLTNPNIKAAITEAIDRVTKKAEVSYERWLLEQKRLAFSDMGDYAEINENGDVNFTATQDLKPGRTRAIQELTSQTHYGKDGERDVTIKLKLHPKQPALDAIGKNKGWLNTKIEIKDAFEGVTDEEAMSEADKLMGAAKEKK